MLREVAEIVMGMAKEGEDQCGAELGRDGHIFVNAFPSSNAMTKGLESLKAGLGLSVKKILEDDEEEEGIEEQLENAEEAAFDDSTAAEDHIDVDQVMRDSVAAKGSVGKKRRMTRLIAAGEQAKMSASGGMAGAGRLSTGLDSDLEGWLEKKSPSHNLWQPRYFKLIVNSKDKAKGGEFSWHKKEDTDKQNSVFLKDIVGPPRVILSRRALVIHSATKAVKLRNKEEDGVAWQEIDCNKGSEDSFEFVIKATMKKKTRELILRSTNVDVMLSWVNGITLLWRKFTGDFSESEEEEEEEDAGEGRQKGGGSSGR